MQNQADRSLSLFEQKTKGPTVHTLIRECVMKERWQIRVLYT